MFPRVVWIDRIPNGVSKDIVDVPSPIIYKFKSSVRTYRLLQDIWNREEREHPFYEENEIYYYELQGVHDIYYIKVLSTHNKIRTGQEQYDIHENKTE
jgi:hypothetical protein